MVVALLLLPLEGSFARRVGREGTSTGRHPGAPAGAASLLWRRDASPALSFEPNRGQFDGPACFVGRGAGASVFLTPDGAEIALSGPAGSPRVSLRLLGASASARMRGRGELPGVTHYLHGNDPAGWITDVPSYASVAVEGVYPGIDLVYRDEDGRLAYDFVVAPGADPGLIRLVVEGAEPARVDPTGDLLISTGTAELRQRPPFLYQEEAGGRREVQGGYSARGPEEVGFLVASFDRTRPLVIDPSFVYSTFHGGCRGVQGIQDIAVDADGNVYVAGFYPADCDRGPPDAYVAKFDANGALLFRTNFGGHFDDTAKGVAVDAGGNIYVTGGTRSSLCCRPFPVVNPIQANNAGGMDAFVSMFDPTGRTILLSTFLGGGGDEHGADIEVVESGIILLAGTTTSADFPTAAAEQPLAGGDSDAFVAALDPVIPALVFSTYLGGVGTDAAARIARAGPALLVAGTTSSVDFPTRAAETTGPAQPAFGGGASDAFLARYEPTGALAYATFLGGSGRDEAYGVGADAAGAGHVTGATDSPDFPIAGTLQPNLSFPPEADVFLSVHSPTGTRLERSTYLEVGRTVTCGSSTSVTLAPCGGIAVDGEGSSFVTAPGVFALKVDATGESRLYTFHGFGGKGIALSPAGHIHVAGRTGSFLFPTLNASDPEHHGFETEEGWLAKLADGPNPGAASEQDDQRIVYTGSWVVETGPEHSGGSAAGAREAGARAALTFSGTGIQVIGRRDAASGVVSVSLDEDPSRQGLLLDTYGSPAEARALLLSFSGLDSGAHTLTLEVSGTHGARSSDDWVWIDGFNVLGGLDPGVRLRWDGQRQRRMRRPSGAE